MLHFFFFHIDLGLTLWILYPNLWGQNVIFLLTLVPVLNFSVSHCLYRILLNILKVLYLYWADVILNVWKWNWSHFLQTIFCSARISKNTPVCIIPWDFPSLKTSKDFCGLKMKVKFSNTAESTYIIIFCLFCVISHQ